MMFEKWFLVPLPKGPLEAMLGFDSDRNGLANHLQQSKQSARMPRGYAPPFLVRTFHARLEPLAISAASG